jgi:Fic family protein
MIVNNYAAMEWIRELRAEPLEPDVVLELHAELSRDALEDPAGVGRLRLPGEDIKVVDNDGQVLHRPPPAQELPARLAAMCSFANAPDDAAPFVHPVVRSVLLHFWLAYDHPFVDGNGRTARALFYWSMLRRGYWLFEFITISNILRKAPAAYARAFLHAETDDDDATYFVVHQLYVIERAIAELHGYLRAKMQKQRELQSVLRASVVFNHRQRELLQHALRHPAHSYTLEGHQRSHDVAYQTARTDVLDLVERGLLIQRKVGKRYVFAAERDLEARLKKLG